MLLGESGLGKGFPINRAKLLVSKANVTRVIAGRSSIQAIVQELSRTKTIEGKPLITDSRGFIINGELNFLQQLFRTRIVLRYSQTFMMDTITLNGLIYLRVMVRRSSKTPILLLYLAAVLLTSMIVFLKLILRADISVET
jgi:hypothetical protein